MSDKKFDFKPDAKIIIDLLFDTKQFKEDVTRDDMNATEEFLTKMMEMRFDSFVSLTKLQDRIRKMEEESS